MTLMPLFRETFRSPREAAVMLLSIGYPREVIAMAFVLVMVLSILVTEPLLALAPPGAFDPTLSPLPRFLLTMPFSAALVWVIWRVGRGLGGRAQLSDAFLIFTYLEGLLTLGLAAMLVMIFLTPILAGLLGLAITVLWIWLLGVFYAEAFDFASPFKALGIILFSWFVVYSVGIVLLTVLGSGGTG